jgi:hypothetical protein
MKFCYFLFIALLLFPVSLFAQSEIHITRTSQSPNIDGVLSEDVWNQVEPITEFIQREPRTGEPVSEETEFYVMYDDHYLYIGIRCFDNPEEIVAREMARDVSLINDDRVQIILDTHLDGRTGYWFQIGPRGSRGDALIGENGAAFNNDWQGLWEGKATIQPHGWEAELAIPFKTLNFNPSQSTWGIKFIRQIRRKQESAYWPVANLNSYRFQVSDAGTLAGMEGISQGIGLDVTPYALGGHNYNSDTGYDLTGDAGVDVFYQLTSGIRSVVSVNTDFAETEADARQINLTRFGIHFPEKRDFFLDGINYFNFGISGDRNNPYGTRLIPFFSRRLGLDSSGRPVPIHAGGRITGQAGNWNIGVMNIYQEQVYDNNNFSALRLSRNFGRQSSAGMIATMGNATGEGRNIVAGFDARVGTSEFRGNRNLSLTMYGLQSIQETVTDDYTSDHAYGIEVNYPNDFVFGRAGFIHIDEQFNAGIGFVPRPGVRELYLNAGIGPRPDKFGILQITSSVGFNQITNLEGALETRKIELQPAEFRFDSGESIQFQTVFNRENFFEEFNLANSVIIPTGNYRFTEYEIFAGSARQRNLWAELTYNWGDFYHGTKKTIGINTGWQIFIHAYVGAEMEKSYLRFPGENVDIGVYRFLFNILVNPDINLYTFVQYDDISESVGWQSRFQWIIRPGRELLLAWNSSFTDPLERYTLTDSAIRAKLKFNIRF